MNRAVTRVLRRILVGVVRDAAPTVLQMVWETWLSPCARLARAHVRAERNFRKGRDVLAAFWSRRARTLGEQCAKLEAMPDGTCAKQIAELVAREVLGGAVR